MSKQVISICDWCGKPGDDVRTYAIRTDGLVYEVDLDEQHAEALLKIARKGRAIEAGASRSSSRQLERRIRHAPE